MEATKFPELNKNEIELRNYFFYDPYKVKSYIDHLKKLKELATKRAENLNTPDGWKLVNEINDLIEEHSSSFQNQ